MAFTTNNIIDGLEAIANAHTSLGSGKFFRSMPEFNALYKQKKGFCMLMNPVKGRLGGQNESAIYKYYTVGFCINKPVIIGDFDSYQSVLAECEAVALDIISRIREKSLSLEGTTTLFPNFKFQSVQFDAVDLEMDNRIGYDITFELYDQISLAWDDVDAAAKWSDVP